ncbi:MAG: PAS domain-containing protein, partial [Candidatus Methylomirabilis sp.]|nr:PAS domain-containing protein [Deltaproteobacteria bacterium]
VEIINYHKSGRPYWVAIEVQPLRDDRGHLTGFMAIESDINKRKIAEENLVASERRLSALTREVPGVIFQFDVSPADERRFSFLSKGYQELFGGDPAAVMAKPALLFDFVHPADRRSVMLTLQRAVSRGTPWLDTFRIIRGDGTVHWVDARSTTTRGSASSADPSESRGRSFARAGVRVIPGARASTSTPSPRSSCQSASPRERRNALVAA